MHKSPVEKFALAVTRGIGSPLSIIIHTILFALCFVAALTGEIDWDKMLLVLTTIVSLEAIYLAIFIQMTINYTTQAIEEVGEDVVEMQEDIGEIQEDIEEVQEDVDEIQTDVDELQEDVEDISEDVEEMSEDDTAEEASEREQKNALDAIKSDLQKLLADVDRLKGSDKK